MMYFITPGMGLLIAIVIIGWLIGAGIKSVGRNVPSVDPDFDRKYKEIMKNMGPMTWQERIVSVILITAFVALVIWIASVT